MSGRGRPKKRPIQRKDPLSMLNYNHAEVIRRAKERKDAYNWTNDVLAEKAGVSITTVSKFFMGDSITMMNMFYILDALGMDFQVI